MTPDEAYAPGRLLINRSNAEWRLLVPKDYVPATAIITELRRYDPTADAMVAVTQDWVDDAQKTMNRQWMELREAREEIEWLKEPKQKAPEPTFDFDRMFKRIDKARAAFGGI